MTTALARVPASTPAFVSSSLDRFGGWQEACDYVRIHGGTIRTIRGSDPTDYRYVRYEVHGCDGVGREMQPRHVMPARVDDGIYSFFGVARSEVR